MGLQGGMVAWKLFWMAGMLLSPEGSQIEQTTELVWCIARNQFSDAPWSDVSGPATWKTLMEHVFAVYF